MLATTAVSSPVDRKKKPSR